jgi:hypothetical protein
LGAAALAMGVAGCAGGYVGVEEDVQPARVGYYRGDVWYGPGYYYDEPYRVYRYRDRDWHERHREWHEEHREWHNEHDRLKWEREHR